MVELGGYFAYVFLFGIIPYMGYSVGRGVRWVILPPKTTKKVKIKSAKKPASTPKPPKPPKSSYRVESSFKEEYRITNPVEFDT